MTSASSIQGALSDGLRALGRWAHNWWRILKLGGELLALALSPSTYGAAYRHSLLRHVYYGTAPSLVWFTVLITLISLVVIRIVLVTSVSYGLTQYALEMVVRVLVLELIPLAAALFAALRCTIPQAGEVADLRARGATVDDAMMRMEILPRVSAGVVCALLLASVSCAITLVLAYLSVYGFTSAGFPAYTRTVGHVFSPGIALVFALKVLAMAMAVALLPLASLLIEPARRRGYTQSAELRGLVRMFFAILLIEGAALVGNYY